MSCVLLVQIACADVVFDPAGEGAGGSGGASQEGGGTPGSVCQAFCQANVDLCGDEIEPCLRHCRVTREHFGRCTDIFDAFIDCRTPTAAAACEAPLPTQCEEMGRDAEACTYPPGDCDRSDFEAGSPSTLTCGDVVYASICEGELATGATCTCVVDDEIVGACREELNLATGECCMQFYSEGESR